MCACAQLCVRVLHNLCEVPSGRAPKVALYLHTQQLFSDAFLACSSSVNFNEHRARQELRQLGYRSLDASGAGAGAGAAHTPQRQGSPAGRSSSPAGRSASPAARASTPQRSHSPAPAPQQTQRELTPMEKSQREHLCFVRSPVRYAAVSRTVFCKTRHQAAKLMSAA